MIYFIGFYSAFTVAAAIQAMFFSEKTGCLFIISLGYSDDFVHMPFPIEFPIVKY